MDAEDRPTFSECVTYLEAYLADKTFTLPSNTDQQASRSNVNGQAGDYVRLRASNKNGDKSTYQQMQDGDEHMMMTATCCQQAQNMNIVTIVIVMRQ
jgi:hypothetical protein